MPSYLITGVSRGLGTCSHCKQFAFLEHISSDASNTVIGLVRNIADTNAKVAPLNRNNIHIIEGDMKDYESLKKTVESVSAITSGTLDYIIANAGLVPTWSQFDPFSVLGEDPKRLTTELNELFSINVVGNIHLFNLFVPLVLKGNGKKIITITSGLADLDLAVKYQLYENAPYSISKAAMNMAVAKFQAEYEKDGVLFLGISPGSVNVGQFDNLTQEEAQKLMVQGAKFQAYAPHFQGPITTEQSVKAVLSVAENASLEMDDGGAFISHLGNKQWL
ncbi:NAD(P)-binding protein [Ophiobolus disseminans]|uniref:NAD(P)-binding protein n=1 Tax=Ophiobolus disseminans TaxID=1469910 RepID=A0A6A7A5M5_9PLEO|nr:NAD(P)-binding protein [Ophiobolus disseminans]